MTLFAFTHFDQEKGTLTHDVLACETLEHAHYVASANYLYPQNLTHYQPREDCKKLPQDWLIESLKELSFLLACGTPLTDAFTCLANQQHGSASYRIYHYIVDRLKEGHPLSTIFEELPLGCDRQTRVLIKAAEQTGTLAHGLALAHEGLSASRELQKNIWQMSAYPILLFSFAVITFYFLLSFSIPSLETLLQNGQQLPMLTKIVLSISHYKNTLFAIFFLFLFGFIQILYRAKKWRQSLLFSLPIVAKVLKNIEWGYWHRAFALPLQAKMTIHEALHLAAQTTTWQSLKNDTYAAMEALEKGESFVPALEKVLPPWSRQLLIVLEAGGESTSIGKAMVQKADADAKVHIKLFLSLLQPALLIMIGLMVGGTVLATLLPLSQSALMLQE